LSAAQRDAEILVPRGAETTKLILPSVRRSLAGFFRAVYPNLPHLDPRIEQGGERAILAPLGSPSYFGGWTPLNELKRWSPEQQYHFWVVSAPFHIQAWGEELYDRSKLLSTRELEEQTCGANPERWKETADLLYWFMTEVELQPYTEPVIGISWFLEGAAGPAMQLLPRLEASGRPSLVFAARASRLKAEIEDVFGKMFEKAEHSPIDRSSPLAQRLDRAADEIAALRQFLRTNGRAPRPDVDPDIYSMLNDDEHPHALARWEPYTNLRWCQDKVAEARKRFLGKADSHRSPAAPGQDSF
jgi:hypothetical protein